MKSGNWKVDGSSIRFDKNGILLDGQNRLLACIKANKSFRTLVIRGLDSNSQSVMDTGVARKFSDILKLEGEVNTTEIASGIGVIHCVINGYKTNTSSISNSEKLFFLDNHPEIRVSASRSSSICKYPELKGIISKGQIVGLHYLFNLAGEAQGQPGAADLFFEALANNPKYVGDRAPFHAVRTWILKYSKNASQLYPRDRTAVIIKSWNAWMSGRPMVQMKWTSGGPKAEEYPKIFGLPS
jgi:hypothetical protein